MDSLVEGTTVLSGKSIYYIPASTHRPIDVQWMFGRYVLWTCQNMF